VHDVVRPLLNAEMLVFFSTLNICEDVSEERESFRSSQNDPTFFSGTKSGFGPHNKQHCYYIHIIIISARN